MLAWNFFLGLMITDVAAFVFNSPTMRRLVLIGHCPYIHQAPMIGWDLWYNIIISSTMVQHEHLNFLSLPLLMLGSKLSSDLALLVLFSTDATEWMSSNLNGFD
mmetsp:Transcript_45725/g.95155  ORF Transcript_45725/g.95155 Transcript_45725/m.95155 type:complete len:104 (-) Transcript_45725:131-442(-)